MFPRLELVISYSLGSDNGLAPKRRQAIIWTNGNPAYRHIYAPVGFLLVLLANMRRTGLCKLIVSDTNLPLPRRHNEDAGVSNHRIDCSLQRLFRRRSPWVLPGVFPGVTTRLCLMYDLDWVLMVAFSSAWASQGKPPLHKHLPIRRPWFRLLTNFPTLLTW